METSRIELTPEQQKTLSQMAEGTGVPPSSLASQAIDIMLDEYHRQLQKLRQAVQEGIDSGPASLLDMEEIKAEARRRWELSSAQ